MASEPESREAWLAQRRTGIGSSDAPAIVGCGYANQSPFTIWADKTGLTPSDSAADPELLEAGLVLQPAISELARRRTGYDIQPAGDFAFVRHPTLPWLVASPDSYIHGDPRGLGICELKNVGGYNLSDWQGDEPPLAYHVQLTHQLLAAGATWGIVCGLIGGNRLAWHEVTLEQRFADALVRALAEFWRYVETKTPPPVDASYATAQALLRLHPNDNGTAIALPGNAQDWHGALEFAKGQIKAAERIKSEAENRIKAAIGDATWGVLPDGTAYSWKTQTRAAHEVKESTYRVLKAGAKVPAPALKSIEQGAITIRQLTNEEIAL